MESVERHNQKVAAEIDKDTEGIYTDWKSNQRKLLDEMFGFKP